MWLDSYFGKVELNTFRIWFSLLWIDKIYSD